MQRAAGGENYTGISGMRKAFTAIGDGNETVDSDCADAE